MNTVTHALAPVLLARWIAGRRWADRKVLILVGVAGALPDLLNPHLSLEARLASWSHGLPAWFAFSLLVLGLSAWKRNFMPPALAVAMTSAYLLHLACDAISGGVDWLHPLGTFVRGAYWVDPILWVPLDIILILSAYIIFRALPNLRRARANRNK